MGIRFFCPNGHKLHVKSFQAGHRGICPYCGATIEIPFTSTRGTSKSAVADKTSRSASSSPDEGTINLNAIAPSSPSPSASPAESSFVSHGMDQEIVLSAPLDRAVSVPHLPTGTTTSEVVSPANTISPSLTAPYSGNNASSPVSSPVDPFAEAPTAVWYVRPVSGGQYGPASGDIMKSWLNEGRVAKDSFVWREGWPDWKEAQNVFEQLAPVSLNLGAFGSKDSGEKAQSVLLPGLESGALGITTNNTNPLNRDPGSTSRNTKGNDTTSKNATGNAGADGNGASVAGVQGSGVFSAATFNWKDPKNIVIAVQTTIILILIMIAILK